MSEFLYDYQMAAVEKMFTGCILNGGVGSGKSRTGLYYYFKENGGSIKNDIRVPMKDPKDLYIITTAMKRDSKEWDLELAHYAISTDPDSNSYENEVYVDSWNNIKKYVNVSGAFFIFDEDRVTGNGAWVKSFYKIASKNDWIILSATPGDTWEQYIPVFVANKFYKNRSEFIREHVVYAPYTKYQKIDRYLNTQRLKRLRNKILIDMDFSRSTVAHHEDVFVDYDKNKYKGVMRDRWDIYKNEPINQASGLCLVLRKLVNSDFSRREAVLDLIKSHPRVIIFYNYNYERDILLELPYPKGTIISEWTGFAHQPVPTSDRWVYLVQYTAGNEGWNCITTDTIIFYSQNYSYKVMAQASGRIDRLTSPYRDLYYYHLKSKSSIDLAISRAVASKKQFNENRWINF